MSNRCRFLLFIIIWSMVGPAAFPVETTNSTVDLKDVQAIWHKVMQVNQVWLQPHVDNLHYTLLMGNNDVEENPINSIKVWVSGELGKYEIEDLQNPEDNSYTTYTKDGYYRVLPNKGDGFYSKDAKIPASLRQGTAWSTSLHYFAEQGLPDNAQIVDVYETPTGQVVVLDVSKVQGRTGAGLGVAQVYFGSIGQRFDKARIHIQIPSFQPILEEIFFEDKKVSEINIGPDFFHFGEHLAPKTMAHHQIELHFDQKSWTLAATFQQVGNLWILKEGNNIQGGTVVKRIVVTDISTNPIDPDMFSPPPPEIVATLKTKEQLQKEMEANRAQFEAEMEARRKKYEPEIQPNAPKVIHVSPEPDAQFVPTETEIRIQFDRPMDQRQYTLCIEEGGLWGCQKMSYNPDTFEFIFPVHIPPGMHHVVLVNKGFAAKEDFVSLDGIAAAPYQWGFDTVSERPLTQSSPKPEVVSVSPESGSTVSGVTPVTITFNCPMASITPVIAAVENENEENHLSPRAEVGILGDIQFDATQKQATLLLTFSRNWKGEFEIEGFRSQDNVVAEPILLHYESNARLYDMSLAVDKRKQSKDARLLDLVKNINEKRQALTSIIINGYEQAYSYDHGLITRVCSETDLFAFEGEHRFRGSTITSDGTTFNTGCDGNQCWFYCQSSSDKDLTIDVIPYDTIHEINLSIANTFQLQDHPMEECIQYWHLVYLGERNLDGRTCHLVKSLLANNYQENRDVALRYWWIDAQTFLPVQLVRKSVYHGSENRVSASGKTYTFSYEKINEDLPDDLFTLPVIEGSKIVPVEPLGNGYEKYFLNCVDGSNGGIAIRSGKYGPAGTYSSGIS